MTKQQWALISAPLALVPSMLQRQRDMRFLERTLLQAMRLGKRTHARKIRERINEIAGVPLIQSR